MNLPENYVVICTTEKETNEVVNFIEPTNNRIWSFWKYVTISNNVWSIHGSEESVIQWFNKRHNISDYKTFTFKEWKEMKENKFPEKWAILATEENFKEISDFYVKHTDNDSTYKGDFWLNQYFHSHNSMGNKINQMTEIGFSFVENYVKEGFKLISFEQFKEHVLNQKSNKTMQKLIINANELLEIHLIACSSWKSKIANYLTRLDSNQMISFNQQEVDEMFEAATAEQKPTLIRIFGEKEIKTISGWFVKSNSKIEELKDILNDEENKNIWKTKEQAEACLAMSELSHLVYEVNEGWIPNYNDNHERKYVIHFMSNEIRTDWYHNTSHFLTFKTEEIRDKFLEENRELILKAKPLL